MRCSLSGVGVIGRSLLPSFAAAPLAVVGMRQAHGTRLLPRRRKVRSTSFPPDGENYVRSLAPPLPTEPASLGFGGDPFGPARRSTVVRGQCCFGTHQRQRKAELCVS